MGKEMKEYIVKLSPIVKEEELIAMGFVKSLGKFLGGFEEKKGVQVCLAIDFETKLVWITANNDNLWKPDTVWKKKYDFDKDEVIKKEIEKLEKEFSGNGRVLIRASGTEPLVRVMIEGENQEYITEKAKDLANLIEERL